MPAGRPPKYKTPEEMQKVIDEYFESVTYQDDKGRVICQPTMTGLANALDLSRAALCGYNKKDEFLNTIKKARAKVEESLEHHLYGNSVTGAIFNLKNNFGWKDKQEVDQNTTISVVEVPKEF